MNNPRRWHNKAAASDDEEIIMVPVFLPRKRHEERDGKKERTKIDRYSTWEELKGLAGSFAGVWM